MPSLVFFSDLRGSAKRNLLQKIRDLVERAGLAQRIKPGAMVAVKLHFGERGNAAFIRPILVRPVVEAIRDLGARPFLTDANTLYVGHRSDALNHLETARLNGFVPEVTGAPVIIADGLKGADSRAVPVNLPECPAAHLGAQIVEADALVSLNHFKAHELAGFGGAIKNLGMGSGSRRGKLFMHSDISPEADPAKCIACGDCIRRCPVAAIRLVRREDNQTPPPDSQHPELKAVKNPERCIGCGDCVLACPTQAMAVQWNLQIPLFMRRMVAYTKALLSTKPDAHFHLSFINNVSPACDCAPFNDAPLVADLGMAASLDPVALDQACADLVNAAPGLAHGSCPESGLAPGADKFRAVYPEVDWSVQLAYAQEVGLGSREYELLRT